MGSPLDIRDVVRLTGLTSRALRHYEARGLLRPLRTHTGRRLYGSGELERLNQIVALKRAGLTLAQIGRLIAVRPPDLAGLVAAQLTALAVRQSEVAEAIKLLMAVAARLQRGEPVDASTFCEIIRQGDAVVASEQWNKEVVEHFFEKDDMARHLGRMVAVFGSIDPKQYRQSWADLSGRIEAALPLGPGSPEAQAFYEEYLALIEPFGALANSEPPTEQGNEVSAVDALARMDEWQRDRSDPLSMEVFQFLFAMDERRKAARQGE